MAFRLVVEEWKSLLIRIGGVKTMNAGLTISVYQLITSFARPIQANPLAYLLRLDRRINYITKTGGGPSVRSIDSLDAGTGSS